MSEISMYEAQKKKMQGLCDEHDLVYRFEKDKYPIIFTIKPVQGMDAQISMLENVEEVGYPAMKPSSAGIDASAMSGCGSRRPLPSVITRSSGQGSTTINPSCPA